MHDTFPSIRAAVRWATFYVQRPILQRSSLYGVGGDDDVTSTEKRAYAAMIVRVVEEYCDALMCSYIAVVWMKPSPLSKAAKARARNIAFVNRATIEAFRAIEAKLANAIRITDGEARMYRAGIVLDPIPPDLVDPADTYAWVLLLDHIRQRQPRLPKRGIDAVVHRLRGDKIGKHRVRAALGCGMRSVDQVQKSVAGVLQEIEDSVDRSLRFVFSEKGWILND